MFTPATTERRPLRLHWWGEKIVGGCLAENQVDPKISLRHLFLAQTPENKEALLIVIDLLTFNCSQNLNEMGLTFEC